jgi:threonine/homoserine/homoserine lactone efflux protein
MLKLLLFAICVYGVGFVAAIPIGATQLEIARRSINGYLSSALTLVAGSVLSDTMYGIIAFWGIAPFLQEPKVVAIFWIVGMVITLVIGIWIIRQARSQQVLDSSANQSLKKRNVAFMTGFSLAVTNPLMVAWWLMGAQFFKSVGLIGNLTTFETALYLFAGALGIASYLSVLAIGVHKVKHFFSEHVIRRITIGFGVSLLVIAAYFLVRTVIALG